MIPLFRPSCTDLEIKYVTEVLRSGWWGTGPVTEKLEHHFAETVGARHHEVLQDHGRARFLGAPHRVFGRRAVVKVDARFVGERLANRLGDDRLIVDQQHHDRALGCGRIAEDAR